MKINELTKFAITLGLIPWIPAFILYKHQNENAAIIVIAVFMILSLISFISKTFAGRFKKILTVTGGFLGRYIAIIILAIGYIIAVLPTGLIMKAVKRDRLRLKKPDTATYWINYTDQNSDYEYQF